MGCDWCGSGNKLQGPAQRCEKCGGAHWICSTTQCSERAIADCKNMCSACGCQRRAWTEGSSLRTDCAPHLIRQSLPWDVLLGDYANSRAGFFAPTAEAQCEDGRLLITGERHVFVLPGLDGAALSSPLPDFDAEMLLSFPASVGNGIVFYTSTRGALALSVHTGETIWFSNARCHIPPLTQKVPGGVRVWLAIAETDGAVVEEFFYHPGLCLKIGRFESIRKTPAPASIAGGCVAEISEETCCCLLSHEKGELSFWRVDPVSGALQLQQEKLRIALPPISPLRRRLIKFQEWYWVTRDRDGAGALGLDHSQTDGAAVDVFLKAKLAASGKPSGKYGLGFELARLNAKGRRSVDGFWARMDSAIPSDSGAIRAGWCRTDTTQFVLLSATDFVKESGAGASPGDTPPGASTLLHSARGEDLGPPVPTPWGCATFMVERASLTMLYVDFPPVQNA